MSRYVRTAGIESAPVGTDAILYDPTANRFCQLNATAAYVWEKLEHPRTPTELAEALCSHFAVSRTAAEVESDVAEALRQLAELQLVQPAPEPAG